MSHYGEQDALKEAHDYHWESFLETKEFKHFEAAKACAAKIIEYENRMRAYRYSLDLEKMYFATWGRK